MKDKKIVDIRLFEEAETVQSLPVYAGKKYQTDHEAHYLCARYARKLREVGYITGDFDHVYIVMTQALEEQTITPSQRGADKWMKYYDVGVSQSAFNRKNNLEKQRYILELITNVLRTIAKSEEQTLLVNGVYQLLLEAGSEMEITHLTKETSKYSVKVSYQIRPLNKKSRALIEYHDLLNNVRRKLTFLELNFYEDIFFLAASLTLKNGMIHLKPRTSQSAAYHIKSYTTPIAIAIDEMPIIEGLPNSAK
ncbi:hypothetical protein ACX93W_22000 [Paenibacillus sp. CAU 1782]